MGLYHSNDNRHSQVTRTNDPTQRHLEDGPEGAGHAAFGRTRVLGLSSDAALTDFTMGGTVRGIVWSINPYLGCMHACTYCYVPETMHLERNRWGTYVAPKHNLPAVLRRELKHKERRTVYLSTGTDAYQAAERDHLITRRCLRLLANADWPVDILTRSPLVLRDLDILLTMSRARVGLSVPTLDDTARRLLEPQAPTIAARLKALGRLADAGITTYANYAPAYPPTGFSAHEVAAAFKDAGVKWVNHSPWRRTHTFLGKMWDRVHRTPWRDVAQFVADKERQEDWRRQVYAAMKPTGIPIREGFYNRPFDLTLAHEATSQLKLDVPEVVTLTSKAIVEEEPLALVAPRPHAR